MYIRRHIPAAQAQTAQVHMSGAAERGAGGEARRRRGVNTYQATIQCIQLDIGAYNYTYLNIL